MRNTILTISLIILFACSGYSQQTQQQQRDLDKTQKDRDVSEIMKDSDMQDKVFEHIADDPEMRQKALRKMQKSADADSNQIRQDMQTLLEDPEVRERLQSHVQLIQAMLHQNDMDQAGQTGMMQDRQRQDMDQDLPRLDEDRQRQDMERQRQDQERQRQDQDLQRQDHDQNAQRQQQYGQHGLTGQADMMSDEDLLSLHALYIELIKADSERNNDNDDQQWKKDTGQDRDTERIRRDN